MTTDMAMRAARVTAAVLLALLVAACGLKDDLYIPGEDPAREAAPVDARDTATPAGEDETAAENPSASAPRP